MAEKLDFFDVLGKGADCFFVVREKKELAGQGGVW